MTQEGLQEYIENILKELKKDLGGFNNSDIDLILDKINNNVSLQNLIEELEGEIEDLENEVKRQNEEIEALKKQQK